MKIFLFAVFILLISFGFSFADSSSNQSVVFRSDLWQGKTITRTTSENTEIVIDYENLATSINGVESSMNLDIPECMDTSEYISLILEETTFVHIPYYDSIGEVELDVYVESNFYFSNQAALDDFWDKFLPRFRMLKELTGWSSKKWFGVPLEIYVYGHSAACYGGNASPTHSNVVFSDPMYKTGCHKPYYDGGSTYYNNPGELGDWWPYMNTALHEALHSIMPYPIYTRSWLTEGWSEYYMYNTLVPFGDINQETADTYLYNGFAGYQWDPYVANDYHDLTIYNRELQRSHGYDITGHMLSKLRDENSMDWDLFYTYMNNNKESLDRTFSLGPPYIYYTDAFVTYVFGRAMGHTDFYSETLPIFRYDGPSGPGYGMRNYYNWIDTTTGLITNYAEFDWFPEFYSTIDTLSTYPAIGSVLSIPVTIHNNGDVNSRDIPVNYYFDSVLVSSDTLNINRFQSITQNIEVSLTDTGQVEFVAIVNEDSIKIEQDYSNDITSIAFRVYSDQDLDGIPDTFDNCVSVYNPGQEDLDLDNIGDSCDACTDTDGDGFGNPGFPYNTCEVDICEGHDDNVDTDFDGIPYGCDVCIGYDDNLDADLDGVPDGCDICEGYDDNVDSDLDGVPDGCDNCPNDPDNDIDSDGICGDIDNCPSIYNPLQTDADSNGVGDDCNLGLFADFEHDEIGSYPMTDLYGDPDGDSLIIDDQGSNVSISQFESGFDGKLLKYNKSYGTLDGFSAYFYPLDEINSNTVLIEWRVKYNFLVDLGFDIGVCNFWFYHDNLQIANVELRRHTSGPISHNNENTPLSWYNDDPIDFKLFIDYSQNLSKLIVNGYYVPEILDATLIRDDLRLNKIRMSTGSVSIPQQEMILDDIIVRFIDYDFTDSDSDGYLDVFDNCPDVYNSDQIDVDHNGIGDACEGCCTDPTGDINNDGSPQADISDLLFLVDYMFVPGAPAPVCTKEGDVNGDGGLQPDISDLLYLVDYMFTPGAPAPADCQ